MDIIAYDAAFTNTTGYLDKFMASEIKGEIDVLACHQYITSDDAMRRWAKTAQDTNKSLWMSEWGDWTNTKKTNENEVKQMLNYANKLHESFEVIGANAWVMWEPSFIFDTEDDGLKKRKSYWAIAHYSRHAKEGHKRVSAEYANRNYKTTAWIAKDSREMSIITINDSDTNYDVRYEVRDKTAKKTLGFRPEKDNNYTRIDAKTAGGGILLSIPAKSITTIEIKF